MSKYSSVKKLIFTSLTALIPLLFFVILELIFVLFNLFPQQPLFIEEGNVVRVNSNVGERYFNKKIMPVPNLYPQKFDLKKAKNTFRIFCLGGSTTAGFPYEMTVPFPKQLEIMLEEDFRDKKIEVINLGLSAVNSFTVLDWIPDVSGYEPDLVIIYMGHNEFYGAYGTGSTVSISNNAGLVRFVLNLGKLHTTQMIISFLDLFVSESGDASSATVMEKVIGENFISADSELREITYKNYRENLNLILEECSERNVPVLLSNLVSNLKDQPPLDKSEGHSTDVNSALYAYNAGNEYLAAGDTVMAYEKFLEAKDRDAVPFRAHSELNKIISETAEQRNLAFVDMEKAFRYFSPQTIPGTRIFCDHLHPNPVGYRIMANEFRNAITKAGLLVSGNSNRRYSIIPNVVTKLDWEIGAVKLYKLKRSWPFGNEKVDYNNYEPFISEKTASVAMDYIFNHHVWGKAHEEMADFYKKLGDYHVACNEYEAIIEMYPEKMKFYDELIDCATKINSWDIVKNSCVKAIKNSTTRGMYYYNLALAERMTGNIPDALKAIQLAIKAPEITHNQKANFYLTYSRLLVDNKKVDEAKDILLNLLETYPEFAPASELLDKLQ